MVLRLAAVLSVLLFLLGMYIIMDPGQQKKRALEQGIAAFNHSIQPGKREDVPAALEKFLSPEARIRLSVSLDTFGLTPAEPLYQEEFNRESFIHFIDTTLYSLEAYEYQLSARKIALAEDSENAHIATEGNGGASGSMHYHGNVTFMRYRVRTDCTLQAEFGPREENYPPRIREADCTVALRSAPVAKPGRRF